MSAFNVQAGPDRVCGELPLSALRVGVLATAAKTERPQRTAGSFRIAAHTVCGRPQYFWRRRDRCAWSDDVLFIPYVLSCSYQAMREALQSYSRLETRGS